MRIPDHFNHSVLFLGYRGAGDTTAIDCKGTGFLLEYGGDGYLITAKHVSHEFGGDPFAVRLNKTDGSSETVDLDEMEWIEHPDPTVDLAAFPMHIGSAEYECSYLPGDMLVTDEIMESEHIGIGNFTYTVGLFRLLSGERRNLPIVHLGHIAMLPGEERIPIKDWRDAANERRISVEGYLVGSQSLSGLSGSPVFVRSEVFLNLSSLIASKNGSQPPIVVGAKNDLRLLGVWQGAWDAPADQVSAFEYGKPVRVPIGTGIVVPSQKIIEMLDQKHVKDERNAFLASS